jgi:hypothetical protein
MTPSVNAPFPARRHSTAFSLAPQNFEPRNVGHKKAQKRTKQDPRNFPSRITPGWIHSNQLHSAQESWVLFLCLFVPFRGHPSGCLVCLLQW